MAAVTMCICFSAVAQDKGEMAAGVNLLGGFYANDVIGSGIGAKFLYNVTDPIRLAGEMDFSIGIKESNSNVTYGFRDFSVYGHYMFPIADGVLYPLVGIGIFRAKAEATAYGLTVSASESKVAFALGAGVDYPLSAQWKANGEFRLKLHGGNHAIIAVGIAYVF